MSRGAALAWVMSRVAPIRAWPRHKQLVVGSVALALLWAAAELTMAARATIVIVSTSGAPITISIDGSGARELANVAAETPGAGLRLGAFAGTHRLVATASDGRDPEIVEVKLAGGKTYLWAPLATEQCFFVEHTTYGRQVAARAALEELPVGTKLWELPSRIDAWFVPTPRTSAVDHRSTGGQRTTIRQARCGTTPFR